MSDWNEAIQEAADKIPTNWLDPLLSGPDKIDVANMSPVTAVEKVLLALQQRILSLKRPAPLDGWVLVPREPTAMMLQATQKTNNTHFLDKWRAALAAAPSTEKAEGERC